MINLKKLDKSSQIKMQELQKEFGKEGIQLEKI